MAYQKQTWDGNIWAYGQDNLQNMLNHMEDGIEEASQGGGGGSPVWGNITGTLSNQTDLQNALDHRVPFTYEEGEGTYVLDAEILKLTETSGIKIADFDAIKNYTTNKGLQTTFDERYVKPNMAGTSVPKFYWTDKINDLGMTGGGLVATSVETRNVTIYDGCIADLRGNPRITFSASDPSFSMALVGPTKLSGETTISDTLRLNCTVSLGHVMNIANTSATNYKINVSESGQSPTVVIGKLNAASSAAGGIYDCGGDFSHICASNASGTSITTLQSILNSKVPTTRTINGRNLNTDISLFGTDIQISSSDAITLENALSKLPEQFYLNGAAKTRSTGIFGIYAPASSGASGQILRSCGGYVAPQWHSLMQTTAPTSDNTSGCPIIVYLDTEPATYYDGYIYLIKE